MAVSWGTFNQNVHYKWAQNNVLWCSLHACYVYLSWLLQLAESPYHLQLAKSHLQLVFWPQLAPFFSPWVAYLAFILHFLPKYQVNFKHHQMFVQKIMFCSCPIVLCPIKLLYDSYILYGYVPILYWGGMHTSYAAWIWFSHGK